MSSPVCSLFLSFYCWACCYMVRDILVVSWGRLSWPRPLPASCPPPGYWLFGKERQPWCCASTGQQQPKVWCVINTILATDAKTRHHAGCCEGSELHPSQTQYRAREEYWSCGYVAPCTVCICVSVAWYHTSAFWVYLLFWRCGWRGLECVLKIYTKHCVYKRQMQEAVNVMKWQAQKNCCRTCPLNKQLGNGRYWNTLIFVRVYHNFFKKWFDIKKRNQWNSSSCYSHHAEGESSLVLTSVSLATLLAFQIAWDPNVMKDNYPKGSKSVPGKVTRTCFHSYGETEVLSALNTSNVITLSSVIRWLWC